VDQIDPKEMILPLVVVDVHEEAVQLHREFAVQMAHEIAMSSRRIIEACDQMIMICEERPSLHDECIVSCQFQGRVTEKVQLGLGIEESFSMKRRRRDYIDAVWREIMRRRMRPTLAHSHSVSYLAPLWRHFAGYFREKRCEDAPHSESCRNILEKVGRKLAFPRVLTDVARQSTIL
jgi:hypothetical protein